MLLADAGGRFTDRPFPGRGGAVNRAAGLLLAKIADLIEDPGPGAGRAAGAAPRRRPARSAGPDRRGLPLAGVVSELAWSAPADDQARCRNGPTVPPDPVRAALARRRSSADSGLRAMIDDLYDELGPDSFTVTWQHDPRGPADRGAVAFLADLRLLRRCPAARWSCPAAARYRNIKAALPVRHAEGQLALDLFAAT